MTLSLFIATHLLGVNAALLLIELDGAYDLFHKLWRITHPQQAREENERNREIEEMMYQSDFDFENFSL